MRIAAKLFTILIPLVLGFLIGYALHTYKGKSAYMWYVISRDQYFELKKSHDTCDAKTSGYDPVGIGELTTEQKELSECVSNQMQNRPKDTPYSDELFYRVQDACIKRSKAKP